MSKFTIHATFEGEHPNELLHTFSGLNALMEIPCALDRLTTAVNETKEILMALSPNIQKLVDASTALSDAVNTFLANQSGATAIAVQAAIDAEDTDPAVVDALTKLQNDIAILTPAAAATTAAVAPVANT